LVQETDHFIGVRGSRVVVYDDDGVRASMTASWLAQMGWQVAVIKDITNHDLQSKVTGPEDDLPHTLAPLTVVDPPTLKTWLANRSNLSMVIDVGDSSTYVKKHIPGAWWLLRSQMAQDFTRVHKANRYVLTCADGRASCSSATDRAVGRFTVERARRCRCAGSGAGEDVDEDDLATLLTNKDGVVEPIGSKSIKDTYYTTPDSLFRLSRQVSPDGKTYTFARDKLPSLFYADVSPEDRYKAMERLRPQPLAISTTPVPSGPQPSSSPPSSISPTARSANSLNTPKARSSAAPVAQAIATSATAPPISSAKSRTVSTLKPAP
jgi:rhodanese-related sulfurtransferase